jgi:hypothetical protein
MPIQSLPGDNAPKYRRLRDDDYSAIAAGVIADRSNVAIAADLGVAETTVRRARKTARVIELVTALRRGAERERVKEAAAQRHRDEQAALRARRAQEALGLKPGASPEAFLDATEAQAARARRVKSPDAGHILGFVSAPTRAEAEVRGAISNSPFVQPDVVMFNDTLGKRREGEKEWLTRHDLEKYGSPREQARNQHAKEAHERDLDAWQAYGNGLVKCPDGSLRPFQVAIDRWPQMAQAIMHIGAARNAAREAKREAKREMQRLDDAEYQARLTVPPRDEPDVLAASMLPR